MERKEIERVLVNRSIDVHVSEHLLFFAHQQETERCI